MNNKPSPQETVLQRYCPLMSLEIWGIMPSPPNGVDFSFASLFSSSQCLLASFLSMLDRLCPRTVPHACRQEHHLVGEHTLQGVSALASKRPLDCSTAWRLRMNPLCDLCFCMDYNFSIVVHLCEFMLWGICSPLCLFWIYVEARSLDSKDNS